MIDLQRKKDSAAILSHIETLKKEKWLGPAQAWWPDFLFRVDDIAATASILNDGKLLSRNRAVTTAKMVLDSASPGVMGYTSAKWKDYVRLYFRPRTPTQYNNEGIRRPHEYGLNSCCPMPVFLLFSAREVLTLKETMFSNGNLASRLASCGADSRFFRSIPFQDVFHNDALQEEGKGRIVFSRHAEVIYPHELPLDALRAIYCRTPAERDTLLSLLTPEAIAKWSKLIGLSSKLNLHYRQWTFLEEVALTPDTVTLSFNPSSKTPGPFHLEVEVRAAAQQRAWQGEGFLANQRVVVSRIGNLAEYGVVVKLDRAVIYRGHFENLIEPF